MNWRLMTFDLYHNHDSRLQPHKTFYLSQIEFSRITNTSLILRAVSKTCTKCLLMRQLWNEHSNGVLLQFFLYSWIVRMPFNRQEEGKFFLELSECNLRRIVDGVLFIFDLFNKWIWLIYVIHSSQYQLVNCFLLLSPLIERSVPAIPTIPTT